MKHWWALRKASRTRHVTWAFFSFFHGTILERFPHHTSVRRASLQACFSCVFLWLGMSTNVGVKIFNMCHLVCVCVCVLLVFLHVCWNLLHVTIGLHVSNPPQLCHFTCLDVSECNRLKSGSSELVSALFGSTKSETWPSQQMAEWLPKTYMCVHARTH